MDVQKMTNKCQTRGLKVAILMYIVICFHPNATNGIFFPLYEPFGEFQSPGYPDLDDDLHCTWKITAPPLHKIILTFLDFELEEVFFCKDRVEIYEGDVKKGTYRGMELHQQSITSTSNTISVLLISCSTSLLYDRRGIRVSYSTVYPTTLTQETSNKATSTIRIIPSTKPIEATVKGTFTSQIYPMLSKDDVPTPTSLTSTKLVPKLNTSGNNREQVSSEDSGNLVPVILAGLFASIFILIIITIVTVKRRKRRKATLLSNVSTASNENNEASCKQADLSTVVSKGIAEDISHLEYDYAPGTRKPNASNEYTFFDQNRVVFSTKMNVPRLQKKQPVYDRKNGACVCENNASNVYEHVTNFGKG